MAETFSTMLPLGTIAPNFTLTDVVSSQLFSLHQKKASNATVIFFTCNHCPYVKHIQDKLIDIAKAYQTKGVDFIAINSNDVEKYPLDAPDKMREQATLHHFPFPYLYDETQEVAKAYHAACTPDFYIFDVNLSCIYRGRFDSATPGNAQPITGKELTGALDHALSGQSIDSKQYPSVGCSIKWKK